MVASASPAGSPDAPLDLLNLFSQKGFVDLLRRRRLAHTEGTGRELWLGLIDWDGFISLILSGQIPAGRLSVTKNRQRIPQLIYRTPEGIRAEAFQQLLSTGASVVAYDIQHLNYDIGRLCRSIAELLSERVEFGLIATTGTGGALERHYDDADILVLQLEGTKRWIVESIPAPYPVPNLRPAQGNIEAPVVLDVTLKPGDTLLLPAGYRHVCESRSERSLHAGILMWPLTIPRIMHMVMSQLIAEGYTAPLRFDDAERELEEANLKTFLTKKIAKLDLHELRADHMSADRLQPLMPTST